ncbi:hypothetical protein [Novipirellula rosea]|uniref:hypothetical protein n=1 Tax=Novipirellula rosea TaxID=1031540 RepID=UPI0031F09F92
MSNTLSQKEKQCCPLRRNWFQHWQLQRHSLLALVAKRRRNTVTASVRATPMVASMVDIATLEVFICTTLQATQRTTQAKAITLPSTYRHTTTRRTSTIMRRKRPNTEIISITNRVTMTSISLAIGTTDPGYCMVGGREFQIAVPSDNLALRLVRQACFELLVRSLPESKLNPLVKTLVVTFNVRHV